VYELTGADFASLAARPGHLTVLVAACFGRGEPTDSMKKLWAWINEPARDADAGGKLLGGGRFAVFGLGSSQVRKRAGKRIAVSHARAQALHSPHTLTPRTPPPRRVLQTHKEYYNVIGRKMDARLEALGGTRAYPRGEGDASGCIDLDWEAWQGGLVAALKTGGAPPPAAAAAEVAAATVAAAPAAAFSASSPSSSSGATCATLPPAPPKPLYT
jgi:sulfite reductase alpha subunit-like flavoprotein